MNKTFYALCAFGAYSKVRIPKCAPPGHQYRLALKPAQSGCSSGSATPSVHDDLAKLLSEYDMNYLQLQDMKVYALSL